MSYDIKEYYYSNSDEESRISSLIHEMEKYSREIDEFTSDIKDFEKNLPIYFEDMAKRFKVTANASYRYIDDVFLKCIKELEITKHESLERCKVIDKEVNNIKIQMNLLTKKLKEV